MKYEPQFTMGMTEEEFKNANKSAVAVYGDNKGITIYKGYNELLRTFKFFVFSKEKLVKFEEGNLSDDYKFIDLRNL